MRPLGSAEFDRRDLSGGNPVEMMLRRARSQGEASDTVADVIARMRSRQAMHDRMAYRDDDE